MSIMIHIHDDGTVVATHNSGIEQWRAEIDPDDLPHDFPADKQISNGIEEFCSLLIHYADEEDLE